MNEKYFSCEVHKHYTGVVEPREECLQCWKVYGRFHKIMVDKLKSALDYFKSKQITCF